MKPVILLLFIILSSCHKHQTKAVSTPAPVDQCSVFMDFIRDNWMLVDINLYGIRSDTAIRKESIRMFRENATPCLRGMSKNEIYALFGTPSRSADGSSESYTIYYYLKNECNHPVSGCIQLKIRIRPSVDTVIEVLPMVIEFVDY
jgi:hypothetical protein